MVNGMAARALSLAVSTLLLAGCGGSKLLPSASEGNGTGFTTYEQVQQAVAAITPGKTTTSELTKLGLDVKTTPNIEVLSYIGVLDRLPHDARGKDHLPPPIEKCIAAHDRCSAYVFRPQRIEARHVGNPLLDLTGFERHTVSSGWSAEVMLLVQDDVVVYKLMSGRPRIEDTRHSVQPLGPLQNVGSSIVGGGPRNEPDD